MIYKFHYFFKIHEKTREAFLFFISLFNISSELRYFKSL